MHCTCAFGSQSLAEFQIRAGAPRRFAGGFVSLKKNERFLLMESDPCTALHCRLHDDDGSAVPPPVIIGRNQKQSGGVDGCLGVKTMLPSECWCTTSVPFPCNCEVGTRHGQLPWCWCSGRFRRCGGSAVAPSRHHAIMAMYSRFLACPPNRTFWLALPAASASACGVGCIGYANHFALILTFAGKSSCLGPAG